MEIVGLGTRIIECVKVRELIDRHAERFINNVYTDTEAAYCRDRTNSTEHYAAFWAAKDAIFRALGLSTDKSTNWLDVEIVCDTKATSRAVIRGATESHLQAAGITRMQIAFSYTREYATATAIATK